MMISKTRGEKFRMIVWYMQTHSNINSDGKGRKYEGDNQANGQWTAIIYKNLSGVKMSSGWRKIMVHVNKKNQ